MSRLKRPKKPEESFNLDEWTGGTSSLRGIDDAYRVFTTGPQLVANKSEPWTTSGGEECKPSPDAIKTSLDVLMASTDACSPSVDVLHIGSLNDLSPESNRRIESSQTSVAANRSSGDDSKTSTDDLHASPDALSSVEVFISYTVQARPWFHAQDAHSPKEQDLYDEMWKNGKPFDEVSRIYSLAAPQTAARVRITPRNLIPLYDRLVAKLAIELYKSEDRGRKIPKSWRVFSFKEINARRSRAGLTHVIRARNSVTLVASNLSGDVLSSSRDPLRSSPDKLSGDIYGQSPDNLGKTSGVKLSGPSYLREKSNFREGNSSTSSDLVATAIQSSLGTVDDDAVRRIITDCRRKIPDTTDEEIAHFAALSGHRIRAMRNVENPVGLLIVQVPKYFDGLALIHYREEERQRRERAEEAERELRATAERTLADPESSIEDIKWAQSVLKDN